MTLNWTTRAKPTHTGTVTATDSHKRQFHTITVTIHVTDVDEAPEAMKYVHTIFYDYPENETEAVITLTAVDPEGVSPIRLDAFGECCQQPGHTG